MFLAIANVNIAIYRSKTMRADLFTSWKCNWLSTSKCLQMFCFSFPTVDQVTSWNSTSKSIELEMCYGKTQSQNKHKFKSNNTETLINYHKSDTKVKNWWMNLKSSASISEHVYSLVASKKEQSYITLKWISSLGRSLVQDIWRKCRLVDWMMSKTLLKYGMHIIDNSWSINWTNLSNVQPISSLIK